MRLPLIRQGEGPVAAYQRIDAENAARQSMIDRALRQPPREQSSKRRTYSTAAGDERKLRGIPVQARGVGGASPGSRPGARYDRD